MYIEQLCKIIDNACKSLSDMISDYHKLNINRYGDTVSNMVDILYSKEPLFLMYRSFSSACQLGLHPSKDLFGIIDNKFSDLSENFIEKSERESLVFRQSELGLESTFSEPSLLDFSSHLHVLSFLIEYFEKIKNCIQSSIIKLKNIAIRSESRLQFYSNQLVDWFDDTYISAEFIYSQYVDFSSTNAMIKQLFWFSEFNSLDKFKSVDTILFTNQFKTLKQFEKSTEFHELLLSQSLNSPNMIRSFLDALSLEISCQIQLRVDNLQNLLLSITTLQSYFKSEMSKYLDDFSKEFRALL